MREPEVQTSHTFICRVKHVVLLLLLRHGIPPLIPLLVAPDVERLDSIEKQDVEAADAQNDLVAPSVQRQIVLTVDLWSIRAGNIGEYWDENGMITHIRSNNVSRLNGHVIDGSADRTCSYGIAVLRIPADKDSYRIDSISKQGRRIVRNNIGGCSP